MSFQKGEFLKTIASFLLSAWLAPLRAMGSKRDSYEVSSSFAQPSFLRDNFTGLPRSAPQDVSLLIGLISLTGEILAQTIQPI